MGRNPDFFVSISKAGLGPWPKQPQFGPGVGQSEIGGVTLGRLAMDMPLFVKKNCIDNSKLFKRMKTSNNFMRLKCCFIFFHVYSHGR